MAVADFSHRSPYGAGSTSRVVAAFESMIARTRAWWNAARTRSELAQLSPRQLADIGLADADLDEVARKVAYRGL